MALGNEESWGIREGDGEVGAGDESDRRVEQGRERRATA